MIECIHYLGLRLLYLIYNFFKFLESALILWLTYWLWLHRKRSILIVWCRLSFSSWFQSSRKGIGFIHERLAETVFDYNFMLEQLLLNHGIYSCPTGLELLICFRVDTSTFFLKLFNYATVRRWYSHTPVLLL